MATVKDVIKAVLQKLIEGTDIKLELFPHIQIFLSEEEYDRVKSKLYVLTSYVFARNIGFAIVELDNKNYYVTIGLDKEISSDVLSPVDNIKEVSLASINACEAGRLPSISEGMLFDNVFTDTSVKNINWDDIEGFFPVIQTYLINDAIGRNQEERSDYLRRLALFSMCNHPQLLILRFEAETLKSYLHVLTEGDHNIPIDNLLRSLGSNYWKFCFVDVYRCIERLLIMAWVHNYTTTMQSGLGPKPMFDALKKRFHIEKHEDENLNYLLSLLSPDTKALLDAVRNGMNHDKYIYDIRNKIVHYQRNEAEIEAITQSSWNQIIRYMLAAISELYPIFSTYIASLPDE